VHVPVSVGKAYAASWSLFSNTPLQMPLDGNMSKHGDNGKTSVNCWDDLHGCQKPFPKHNLFNWCCLPSLGGHPFPRALNTLDQNPPFAPSLAMSSGIIASSPDLNRLSPLDTSPRLKGSGGVVLTHVPGPQQMLDWTAKKSTTRSPTPPHSWGCAAGFLLSSKKR
ncbi:hypothetical protein F444_13710, partial [Phytophthora nicotianae P1976]